MGMANIYKEHVHKLAWDCILKDLDLPADTDEICIKHISHITETQRQGNRDKNKRKEQNASDNN